MRQELELLKNIDSDLKYLIELYPPLSLQTSNNIYKDIVETIITQMLSLKAGNTIAARVRTHINSDDYNPEILKNTARDELRNCGLSYAKTDHLILLANDVSNGKISFHHLDSLDDEGVINYLMTIKGVGRWTAEMISLFSLARLDVFSYLDVALKNGIIKAKGYKTLSPKRFQQLKKRYHPYGSIASLYFYKCNDDSSFIRPIKK